jgi:hypothetical protein
MLSCETLSEKIKDIKMEAKIHGVDMHRLDINKSGANFELIGDLVYYGFSNVKGIGEKPAEKIVAGQPYKSFEDFLSRCSTDASILKPILGLRCFRDRDPIALWKFSEHFKDCMKKNDDKRKRYEKSIEKYENEFKELVTNDSRSLSDFRGDQPFQGTEWEKYNFDEFVEMDQETECEEGQGVPRIVVESVPTEDAEITIDREVTKYFKIVKIKKPRNRLKELQKLWIKRKRTIERFQNATFKELPKLIDFDPDQHEIPNDLLKELRNPVHCEEIYYGWAWIHELERSPDYRGNLTFDALRNNIDGLAGPVELRVKKSTDVKSQKGTVYRQIIAEDVTGQENKINIWAEDWGRWSEEFKVGNLLRVRLQPPSGGFNTFTLESNQLGKFRGSKKFKDKDDDPRVYVMRFGLKEEEKFLSDDEALNAFSACKMEDKK